MHSNWPWWAAALMRGVRRGLLAFCEETKELVKADAKTEEERKSCST